MKGLGALLGGHHAGEVEDSGYLGGEVPAAGEDLGGGAVGDDDAIAEQDDALGEGRGELDVVGGDENAGAAAGEFVDQLDQILLAGAVHAAGWLVEGDKSREFVAVGVAGEGDRQGETLPLTTREVTRVGIDCLLQTDRLESRDPCVSRQLVTHPLTDEVVAGVLGQKGNSIWSVRPTTDRLDQTGGGSQQRALAGTVAAHEGDALAAGDGQVQSAQDIAPGLSSG